MKRLLILRCAVVPLIGAASLLLTLPASAQTAEPPSAPGIAAEASGPAIPAKVGVILFEQAVAQTNEGQRDYAALTQKYAPKQAQVKTMSDELDSLKKQLQDAGSSLTDQERNSRIRTIDEKTKLLQRTVEDDQNDFNGALNDMLQQLAQKVYVSLDAYCKQNGYTLIIDATTQQNQSPIVIWLNQSTDITKAVIAAYNAKSGVLPPASPAPAASTSSPRTTPIRTSAPR